MTETSPTLGYRKQAEQLRAMALRTGDASRKAELLALAHEFDTLASFAENNPAMREPD